MLKSYSFKLLLLVLTVTGLKAEGQTLDPSFAPTTCSADGASVDAMVRQPDGKVLVSGSFHLMGNQISPNLIRLNSDGTPDVAFNTRVGSGSNVLLQALAVQPDGKILIAARFGSGFDYNGLPTGSPLARLNADGSLDTSFMPAFSLRGGDGIRAIAVQSDGRILVGGAFSQVNTQAVNGLFRLQPNGSLDPAFSIGSGFQGSSGEVRALLIQPDGKIIVGGFFTSVNGQAQAGVARLHATGSRDATFTTSLPASALVMDIARQPQDGRLLLGGLGLGAAGSTVIIRLLADGASDASFTPTTGNSLVSNLELQASGDVLATGYFQALAGAPRGSLARLSSTGALDTQFATGAGGNGIASITELSNGRFLVGGNFNSLDGQTRYGLGRLTSTGSSDPTFNLALGSVLEVNIAQQLSNGQLLMRGVGGPSRFNGQLLATSTFPVPDYHLINANGTYSSALSLPAAPNNNGPNVPYYRPDRGYFPQPDGTFYSATAVSATKIVVEKRLSNGTVAPGFRADTITLNALTPLPGARLDVDQTAGFIYVRSYPNFQINGRTFPAGLARLRLDGSLDAAFAPPASLPWLPFPNGIGNVSGAMALLPQANGRLLVWWGDGSRAYLNRLNPDGTLDNTYSIGSGAGPNGIFHVTPLSGGKVLVHAYGPYLNGIFSAGFTSFNGQAAPNSVVKLNPDGSVDPAFNAAAPLQAATEQRDGGLVGVVHTGNVRRQQLLRLNANGSLDAGFQAIDIESRIATNYLRVSPLLQPADQKIVLYGSFTHVAGQERQGLARLTNIGLSTTSRAPSPHLTAYPNPASGVVTVLLPEAATALELQDPQGRRVRNVLVPAKAKSLSVSLHGLAPGLYILRCGAAVSKLFVE